MVPKPKAKRIHLVTPCDKTETSSRGWQVSTTLVGRARARLFRLRAAFVCVLLVSTTLSNVPTPSSAQGVAPTIAFLNPSSFAEGGAGIIVTDRRPARPEEGDDTYRLSAWVSSVPANAAVEFELLRSGISLMTMDQTDTVGSDTFEADWAIPDTLPD